MDEAEWLQQITQWDMDAALANHGGQDLVDYLTARGLQSRFVPAVATLVNAVCFAIAEPEQYRYVFQLLNEALRALELVSDGAEAAQIHHEPLGGIIDEYAIGLVSGFAMQEFEVLTEGEHKRQRTWLVRQAACQRS